jgi:ribulose-phosphate 3-epimerase
MPLEILPAILAHSMEEYAERLGQVEDSTAKWVHVDVMDGQFVPNISVMPHEIMGLSTRLKMEAHLMTFRPERYYSDLTVAGFSRVILHREAFDTFEECQEALKNAADYFTEVGLALNPETPTERIGELFVQTVQCMGVEPGAAGQPLLASAYGTISQVMALGLVATMAVDGGVSEESIRRLYEAGIRRFVMNSRLFATGAVTENLGHFSKLAEGEI